MAFPTKRIAVVGGGISGIGTIICLKEEGLEPVCFEQTDHHGGTWYYRKEPMYGVPSIMPTTILNHSKEMGAISNFPPRKEYSNYMRHREMLEYMSDICDRFDCLRHVQVNMQVTCVRRSKDYQDTGRWIVEVRNTITGDVSIDEYDGVIVCTGHITYPKMAEYPGQESFKGKIMHTHSLKGVAEFEGQKVVIVGLGCSGADAAVETSGVAKQVYLSTRSGAWIISRVGPHGYPTDYVLMRRYITIFLNYLPSHICSWMLEKFFLDPYFNHELYKIQPKYHFLSKAPMVCDALGSKLLSGSVAMMKDIDHFTENGVVFEGDDHVTEVDTVIMATGYHWQFPFLEEGVVVREDDGRINLYKGMYPPHLKHHTLAFAGFIMPFGPGFPVGELQGRWAAQLLAGKGKLPSEKVMTEDIRKMHEQNLKRYAPSEILTLKVDNVTYMDDIASQFGVKPNFYKMFFTDIRLFWKLYFGPTLSYQYRLEGPHKWEGAREAIMTAEERMKAPLI